MMPTAVRKRLRRIVPAILRAAPTSLAGALIHRRQHWGDRLPPGKEIVFRRYLGDLAVVVDTLYPIEAQMLTGVYDAPTVALIGRYVKAGDTCLDIGANVGAITLALAKAVGESGAVHAVEPGPPAYQRLERNLSLNPSVRGRVRVHRVGISDRAGSLKWSEDMTNRGNAGLLHAEGIEVPVITLDEFCRQNSVTRLDFVKVDVEGMELEVFRGAGETLAALRPALYFETLPAFAEFRGRDLFGGIEEILRGHGYRLYKVGAQADIAETTSADLSANTLALHPGARQGREGSPA